MKKSILMPDPTIFIAGSDENNILSVFPNNESAGFTPCVSPPAVLKVFRTNKNPSSLEQSKYDVHNIIAFSVGMNHSTIVLSDGKAFGFGDDRHFAIGTEKAVLYSQPEFIQIPILNKDNEVEYESSFLTAACGRAFTVYITKPSQPNSLPKVILCHEKTDNRYGVIIENIETRPTAIFSGCENSVIIDENGDFYIITQRTINTHQAFKCHLSEKVISAACCSRFLAVSTDQGHVFECITSNAVRSLGFNNHSCPPSALNLIQTDHEEEFDSGLFDLPKDYHFTEALELHDAKIIMVSGYQEHCIAVSIDGKIYGKGLNLWGQLGFESTNSRFFETYIEIPVQFTRKSRAKIIFASCGSSHTLLITKDRKLYACGRNEFGQLLEKLINEDAQSKLVETVIPPDVRFVWSGENSTMAIVGFEPPQLFPNNPIKNYASSLTIQRRPTIEEPELESKEDNSQIRRRFSLRLPSRPKFFSSKS